MRNQILIGDVRSTLRSIPPRSVQTCVTSPPYWGLRSYLPKGHPDKPLEIGSEATPELFIATMVEVFALVRECLRDDGTLWVNLGDTYASSGGTGYPGGSGEFQTRSVTAETSPPLGYKAGDLCNVPHRVAAALQADGWYWRSTIIWAKRSPMPESVSGWRWRRCRVAKTPPPSQSYKVNTADANGKCNRDCIGGEWVGGPRWLDCPGCPKCSPNGGYVLRKGRWRPTTGHEYLFLFSKSDRYFCDGDSVQEPQSQGTHDRFGKNPKPSTRRKLEAAGSGTKNNGSFDAAMVNMILGQRNPRTVWTLSSEPYKAAHFATFPTELPRRCILAGTSPHCCGACGAPYAPVVESERVATRPGDDTKVTGDRMNDGNRDPQRHVAVSKVTGYRLTCGCPAASERCIVLDPFLGSGTTAQVAQALGRDYIGCELSEAYRELAVERINTPPRFMRTKGVRPERIKPSSGQLELFLDGADCAQPIPETA